MASAESVSSSPSSASAWLAGGQPRHLEAALQRYRAIRDAGGWPELPRGLRLAPGARHAAVPALRDRLRATDDLSGPMDADPQRYDASLVAGVRRFRRRHGLAPSTALDPGLIAALNVPVQRRIAQLLDAKRAWQSLDPPEAGLGLRIWVNIPEAEVTGLQDARVTLRMRAVVGHPSRPTPLLRSRITRVIVNPAWNVPHSIATADLLPRQQADAEYFTANRIRVFRGWAPGAAEIDPRSVPWQTLGDDGFPYRLRQDPGPHNALGRYKFDFRNEFSVYLHDTPSTRLLELPIRSLSSGCVRVADATTLSTWLAGEQAQEIQAYAAQNDRETRVFPLSEAVPIDILYLSAWADPETLTVQFRRDVYERAEKEGYGPAAGTQARPAS